MLVSAPIMTIEQLKDRLEALAPGTRAEVEDLTGTQDHFQAVIVSPAFTNKIAVEQHRMIFQWVHPEIDSGEIHALSLKTYSPEQYAKRQQTQISRF
jgi:stress-induced morphogen